MDVDVRSVIRSLRDVPWESNHLLVCEQNPVSAKLVE